MELCSCQELHHFGATGDTVVNQKVGKQLPPAGNRHKTTKDMKENQLLRVNQFVRRTSGDVIHLLNKLPKMVN